MSSETDGKGWSKAARGAVVKALLVAGGALLLRRLTKSTTRWDHARFVSHSLSGEKVSSSLPFPPNPFCSLGEVKRIISRPVYQFSKEQAARDPDNYFNIRFVD